MKTYYFKGNEAVGKQLIDKLIEKGGMNIYGNGGFRQESCYAIMPSSKHIVSFSKNSLAYELLELYGTEITPKDVNPALTIKQGDYVLVRNGEGNSWNLDTFIRHNDINSDLPGFFVTKGGLWTQCIPYKNNAALLGTICNAPDGVKYIYE